jgi:hypothetical protein
MAGTFKGSYMMSDHDIEKLERTSHRMRQRAYQCGKPKIRKYADYPSFSSGTSLSNPKHESFEVEASMVQALMPQDPNGRPAHFANNFEEAIFVFTVMMATAATTFLQGVIVINTMAIGENLSMTDSQVTWIAAAIG